MIRKIIKIDEDLCIGCGLCAAACHEGAIEMIDGKAKLTREDYCDGLGDCLPACPVNAISFEQREAPAYDEAAVKEAQAKKNPGTVCGCPGSRSRSFTPQAPSSPSFCAGQLRNWPIQIKLAPITSANFNGANLLIAADCSAYAYGNFHQEFICSRITLIGCPKLDEANYAEKLTEIIRRNNVKSVTVTRMEVPCCGGLENAVKTALRNSGKFIPWNIVTISADGKILD